LPTKISEKEEEKIASEEKNCEIIKMTPPANFSLLHDAKKKK
jgi:hypothetical protein